MRGLADIVYNNASTAFELIIVREIANTIPIRMSNRPLKTRLNLY